MTVPRSKVLGVSKGIMALTNLTHNSPDVKQNVVVNVTSTVKEANGSMTPSSKGANKTRNAIIDGVEDPDVVICCAKLPQGGIVEPTTNKEERVSYENPYENLPNETTFEVNKRDLLRPEGAQVQGTARKASPGGNLSSIEDIRNTYKQLNETIKEKENITKALSIMLNLIENNPLIINKIIIAPADVLTELIKLLTSSDEVKFNLYLIDEDVGCTCGINKYIAIDKIYVIKNGETKILKYDYPDAIQILDQHRISYRLVVNGI